MADKFTGIVERCELKQRKPFRVSRYSPNEQDEFYVDVCLRLADGSAVYFNSVAAKRSVASCPGAAIVMHFIDGEASKWMEETGSNKIAVPGIPNDNNIRSRIRVGDKLVISCCVKGETKISRAGNAYVSANRVKLIDRLPAPTMLPVGSVVLDDEQRKVRVVGYTYDPPAYVCVDSFGCEVTVPV